ncbi:MAG: maleylacetate reductase [Rhodospirillaceae bacterium]|nr:maleylacetate reductase [Rhodospirillaceae bacterium]
MDPFIHTGFSSRVVHGAGSVQELKNEVAALGVKRVMFCCTKGRVPVVEQIAGSLGNKLVGICSEARIFVPISAVEKGRSEATRLNADCLVSYGGGTAVGLAKAIALQHNIPIIAIITTYSGSETTHMQGIINHDGVRKNHADLRMLPKTLIYDPELSLDLPRDISIASGFNAIAHAISSFLGRFSNPISEMFAEAGIREMSKCLQQIAADPYDVDARGKALFGAWLCGTTLISAGTTLHHKMVHVLGGGWDLPHGPTHGIMLPHSTAYVRSAQPNQLKKIAHALGDEANDAAQLLHVLLKECGVPQGLKQLNLDREALDEATNRIMQEPYYCAREYDRREIRDRLEDAWGGIPPR